MIARGYDHRATRDSGLRVKGRPAQRLEQDNAVRSGQLREDVPRHVRIAALQPAAVERPVLVRNQRHATSVPSMRVAGERGHAVDVRGIRPLPFLLHLVAHNQSHQVVLARAFGNRHQVCDVGRHRRIHPAARQLQQRSARFLLPRNHSVKEEPRGPARALLLEFARCGSVAARALHRPLPREPCGETGRESAQKRIQRGEGHRPLDLADAGAEADAEQVHDHASLGEIEPELASLRARRKASEHPPKKPVLPEREHAAIRKPSGLEVVSGYDCGRQARGFVADHLVVRAARPHKLAEPQDDRRSAEVPVRRIAVCEDLSHPPWALPRTPPKARASDTLPRRPPRRRMS